MLYVIIIAIAIFVIWKIIKSYRLNTYDTVVAFTGGLGSGKSFMSVQMAIKLLKRKRREVFWYNLFHKEKREKPMLYSSIPVKVSRREMAVVLTDAHLLLQKHIVRGSVVFLDEIGGYCSQFDYRAVNAEVFDEFVRFFRHYVQGYLICNDQCSENIVLQVRRRLNTVYNLMGFRKRLLGLIYTVKVRNISVSEEIKTIEEQDTEDNMTTLIGIMPWFRRYDTHCYAHRYDRVPIGAELKHLELTTDDVLRMSKNKVESIDFKISREKVQKALDKPLQL